MNHLPNHTVLVLLLAAFIGCSRTDHQSPRKTDGGARSSGPKLIPDEVVAAWQKAGASDRVMSTSANGELINFPVSGSLRFDELPAFSLSKRLDPAGLPPVPVPFGLALPAETTDDDLKLLKDMKNLKRLDLSFTRITDQGLTHLRELKDLERLNLRNTKTDPAKVKDLRAALPDCIIDR